MVHKVKIIDTDNYFFEYYKKYQGNEIIFEEDLTRIKNMVENPKKEVSVTRGSLTSKDAIVLPDDTDLDIMGNIHDRMIYELYEVTNLRILIPAKKGFDILEIIIDYCTKSYTPWSGSGCFTFRKQAPKRKIKEVIAAAGIDIKKYKLSMFEESIVCDVSNSIVYGLTQGINFKIPDISEFQQRGFTIDKVKIVTSKSWGNYSISPEGIYYIKYFEVNDVNKNFLSKCMSIHNYWDENIFKYFQFSKDEIIELLDNLNTVSTRLARHNDMIYINILECQNCIDKDLFMTIMEYSHSKRFDDELKKSKKILEQFKDDKEVSLLLRLL